MNQHTSLAISGAYVDVELRKRIENSSTGRCGAQITKVKNVSVCSAPKIKKCASCLIGLVIFAPVSLKCQLRHRNSEQTGRTRGHLSHTYKNKVLVAPILIRFNVNGAGHETDVNLGASEMGFETERGSYRLQHGRSQEPPKRDKVV